MFFCSFASVPPPPQCPYGYEKMVTYKYGELGFITWLDNKPNTDILEGSGKDIVLDNVASHRIVIKRDREPKMFNVLNIELTVMGTGFVIYNLTGVYGQNEIKMVYICLTLCVNVIIGLWLPTLSDLTSS